MNPEFQRNLWLDASPRRIAWAAVVLAMVFTAVGLVSRNSPHPAGWFSGFGLAVFIACGVLWAGRAAGTSILQEVAERTWDFQRLSALSAWEMTWGKLFGATLLASGAGVVGLLVHLAAGGGEALGWELILTIAAALFVQCLSFMGALVGVRKARAEGRVARAGGILGGLFLGYLLLSGFAASRAFSLTGPGHGLNLFGDNGGLSWWGLSPDRIPFWSVTVLVLALFTLAGAWRLMRLELQMRSEPLVWPLFLVVLALWVAGFRTSVLGYGAGVAAAAMAMCLAAYASAFVEPADRVALRRFGQLVAKGQAAEAVRLAPAAVFPLFLALVLTLMSFGLAPDLSSEVLARAVRSPAAMLAFLVRDLGVIALFRFGPRPQRGDFGAVVALAVLYGVGGAVAGVMGGALGTALVTPVGGPLTAASVLSALAQAIVAWLIAIRRIRSPERSVSAPPADPASAPG